MDINKFFVKFLALSFGLTWMVILFKVLGVPILANWSWLTIFVPFLIFLCAAGGYIIIRFCHYKWVKHKPEKISPLEEALNKRRYYKMRKSTRIKVALAKIFIILIAAIIAALILS